MDFFNSTYVMPGRSKKIRFYNMKTSILKNLQSGNQVTQRNTFLIIAIIIVVAAGVLNHYGIINLSLLNLK